ncbi:hypothetical protein, conserved [Eimeria necatrix]|uniref:Uncharacterized protein n=1 Tax=Eimeria necatrix TaxID=51315 RepID=U6MYX2_9EIME|nr:hypothetical protein, conserved [Eimeria necatrix]CDJ66905.1 hypothetical protein, conserved [Eimeria necatrix]
MAGLAALFRESLHRLAYRQLHNPLPVTGSVASHPGIEPKVQSSTQSPTLKALEETVDAVNSQAIIVAQENPAALAHLTAYFHVVESADALYQKYKVPSRTVGQSDVQRAANLVGLRLPDASP